MGCNHALDALGCQILGLNQPEFGFPLDPQHTPDHTSTQRPVGFRAFGASRL